MDASPLGQLDRAVPLVGNGDVMVLSGAGLSTDSGIPDYRGPTGSTRSGTPMTYQEFTKSDRARQRYWARSHVGWRTMRRARPNAADVAIAELERANRLSGIVTQNVDGLHQAAGASSVVELHGNLSAVVCLACSARTPRLELDARLRGANPDWEGASARSLPDGDSAMENADVAGFRVAASASCGGMLKPDVVFFGESVPKERVQRCFSLLESSSALLVVGSSLTVMSGYRFVLKAAKLGKPVVIINQGETRGDDVATVRIEAPLGRALPYLARRVARS